MNVGSPHRRSLWRSLPALLVAMASVAPAANAGHSNAPLLPSKTDRARGAATQKEVSKRMAKLPLYYEPNAGQAAAEVQALSRGGGFTTLLDGRSAYFVNSASPKPFGVEFEGGAKPFAPVFEDELPGVTHYYKGSDPSKWRTNIKHYARVRFPQVYPGIDVVFYSSDGRMEYDFVAAPGADPSAIKIAWKGVEATRVDESGDLIVTTAAGNLRQKRPVVYQEIGGKRVPLEARYQLNADGTYALDLGKHDEQYALVIDPTLQYSTYLGGAQSEESFALYIDALGNAVIGGYTSSIDFPFGPNQLDRRANFWDAVLTKIDNEGKNLIFTAILGGESNDFVSAVTSDGDGNYYLCGQTGSYGFPISQNAFQSSLSGLPDAFVTKISSTGTDIIFSTYFGAPNSFETATGIAVDVNLNVTIAGTSDSAGLPVTQSAYDRTYHGLSDGYVAKFTPNGRQLVFCTYIGGAQIDVITGLTQDVAGEIYFVGSTQSADFPTTPGAYQRTLSGTKDAFVCKMSQNGKKISFCTLFGGTGAEEGQTIALETGGRIVIGGYVTGGVFPATANALRKTLGGDSDAFVARLNTTGSTVIAATLLGGLGAEFLGQVLSLNGGYMAVAGTTTSANFPSTGDAFQFTVNTSGDAFFSVLTPLANALSFSTILGGSSVEQAKALARDRYGDTYIAGATNSTDLPVTSGVFQNTLKGNVDQFVVRILGISGQECAATVTSTGTTYGSTGGGGGIAVGQGCSWNAFSAAPWVTFTDPNAVLNQTSGSLNYTVAASTSTEPRTASIQVAGNLVQILQKGTTNVAPYSDVAADNQFSDYVRIIKTNGVTTGCNATGYCPNDATTRAQMAVFIVRSVLGTDDFTVRTEPYFADVPITHPLFKWIQKLREMGITTGCTIINYCPNDPVTRGQMAVFMVRAKYGDSFIYNTSQSFNDVEPGNLFYTYIQKLKQLGITAGCTATNYCPNDSATRAQMAVFLTRMFFTPW